MAASAWAVYDQFKLKLGKKVVNLASGGDTFKMALFTSASNANQTNLATATYVTLTNELANANGYTTAGVTLGSVDYTNTSGTEKFTSAAAVWTASGSGLTGRYAVVYDSTTGDLVCWCYLDATPADVSASSGQTLTVNINASGIFTLA